MGCSAIRIRTNPRCSCQISFVLEMVESMAMRSFKDRTRFPAFDELNGERLIKDSRLVKDTLNQLILASSKKRGGVDGERLSSQVE